jgi:hypothetical protein
VLIYQTTGQGYHSSSEGMSFAIFHGISSMSFAITLVKPALMFNEKAATLSLFAQNLQT